MIVESPADRLMFLSAGDFGCVFSYQAAGGGLVVPGLAGIFDNDYLGVEGDGAETTVSTRSPRLTCRAADLVGEGTEGDIISITSAPSQPEIVGRVYKVTVPRPDGTGMALLWLERMT